MKFAITITLREFTSDSVNVHSKYCEFDTIKALNDYIFSSICNTELNEEIINLFFEVIK